MSSQRRLLWSQLRIGFAVVLGAAASALAIFFIDDVRDAVEERYTLYFYTFTTQTLRPRAPVWLAGQPVGHVKQVAFEPPARGRDELLRVELDLSARAQPFVTEGAAAQVITSGLIGETVVNILPAARPGDPLPDQGELATVRELDPQQIANDLRALYDSLPPVVDRWREVQDVMRTGDGTLPRHLRRPEELSQLVGQLDRASALFDTLGLAAGGMSDLLTDKEVRSALTVLAPRLEELAQRWERGEGTAARLARDRALPERLEQIEGRLARIGDRVESGRGTLGRLLRDRALATELARTRELVAQLRADLRATAVERRRPRP